MRVLVIGGSYFIGRTLVDRLLAEGHEVTLVNRGSRMVPGVSQLVADRNRLDDMQRALAGLTFDWVMDMSCYGPEQAALACEALDSRFGTWLYLSTAAVYPGGTSQPFAEDAVGPGREWEDYGWKKLQAERELERRLDTDRRLIILRAPYVYGPMNTLAREKWLWARMLQGLPIWIPRDGRTRLHFVHVADLADAMLLIALRSAAQLSIFNVAQVETPTIREYVALLAETAGLTPRVREVDYAALGLEARSFFPFRDFECLLNPEALAQQLGWRARYRMREGLAMTLSTLGKDALLDADATLAVEERLTASGGDA